MMSYKIAVTSEDGVSVDIGMREARNTRIYRVSEDGACTLEEIRPFPAPEPDGVIRLGEAGPSPQAVTPQQAPDRERRNSTLSRTEQGGLKQEADTPEKNGRAGDGCGSGCGLGRGCGSGSGCGPEGSPKIERISDCRALVTRKAGLKMQRAMSSLGISEFETDGCIDELLPQIIRYFDRRDRHQSLRNFTKTKGAPDGRAGQDDRI